MKEEISYAVPMAAWIRINPINRDIINSVTEKHRVKLHFGEFIPITIYDQRNNKRNLYIRRTKGTT